MRTSERLRRGIARILRPLPYLVVLANALTALVGFSPAHALDLLVFEAPWCAPCQKFQAEVLPHYAATPIGRSIPIFVMGMDQENRLGAVLTSPLTGVPAFVLVDGGRETARFYGYSSFESFFRRLQYASTYR